MKVFDAHGDLFSHFFMALKNGETNIFENYHLSKFKQGDVKFGVFNFWLEDSADKNTEFIMDMFSYGIKEVLTSNYLKIIRSYNDFDLNSDKVQFIIGLEGIDYLNKANDIYMMYQYGARLISLTWNGGNKFASSNTCLVDNGLSEEGIKAVKIMNALGIIIDISHLSDKSSLQILDLSSKPVIASHSNVRKLVDNKRNLTDELILKIAKTNGVIGMNSFVEFVADKKEEYNVEGMMKHMNYIKNLVGVDHICFGFDFMDYLVEFSPFTEGIEFMNDLQNHKDIGNLIEYMKNHNYTNEEIEKIAYKNFFRVMKEIL
ncbi:MAG: dipeptidase [Bacilli bacterium]